MVSERRNRDWRIGAMELVQMRLIRKYLLDFLFPLLWRHRQRKGIPFEFCPFKEFLETGSAHRNAELNFSLFKFIKEFSKGKTRWNMIVEIKWAFWMRGVASFEFFLITNSPKLELFQQNAWLISPESTKRHWLKGATKPTRLYSHSPSSAEWNLISSWNQLLFLELKCNNFGNWKVAGQSQVLFDSFRLN